MRFEDISRQTVKQEVKLRAEMGDKGIWLLDKHSITFFARLLAASEGEEERSIT